MKKLFILSGLLIGILFSANAQLNLSKAVNTVKSTANEAISSEVLSALVPSESLSLTDEQTEELTQSNETFVNKVLNTIESTNSDEEKTSILSSLKSDRITQITSLLGENKASTYLSQAKEKLEALTEKYEVVKNFL